MSRGYASNYRILLLAAGLFASFAGLGARLVYLHVIDREELLRYVLQARQQITPDHARRGDILDAKGSILATSRSLLVVGVDPRALRKEDEKKWPALAALLQVPLPELERIFTTRYRTAPRPPLQVSPPPPAETTPELAVAMQQAAAVEGEPENPPAWAFRFRAPEAPRPRARPAGPAEPGDEATEEDAELEEADGAGRREVRWAKITERVPESVYAQVERLGIKGVYGLRTFRRAYPHDQLAAHVIGYVDGRQRAATGIERFADFYLRGQDGWRESEKDGLRRELAQFRSREVPRADGFSVRLSLRCDVQDLAEQELAALVERFQPQKATIIVMNPRDGFVSAMANYPTFNLNEFNKVSRAEQASMRNIAVTDIIEPGSTFKIVSVSAGLQEGLITPEDRFDCTLESVDYLGRTLKLPKEDHHFDHELTVAEIVSRSSNKGAAQIGMKLGKERIYQYARAFGFGRALGFPTGGEVGGILNRPEKWNELDITRIPMGHTIAATPLQMICAMATIANHGVLLRPQIVREIRDAAGERVYSYEKAEVGRAISRPTADLMARLLMGVALKEGTGETAAIPGFQVAGKTGTTQKLLPVTLANGRTELRYSDKHHIASFVGFFPATNPQVAIAVIVDDADAHAPGNYATGHVVAAPAFKHLGEELIPLLNIAPPPPVETAGIFALGGNP